MTMKLTEPVTAAKLLEFVAWHEGRLEGMARNPEGATISANKVLQAYVQDVGNLIAGIKMLEQYDRPHP